MGVVMGLQWRDQLSVGNDLIDGDHKYLIDIINKVEVSMKANNRAELMALLDELGHYGKTHFEREELVAKAVGYPQADQLHESHIQLVASGGAQLHGLSKSGGVAYQHHHLCFDFLFHHIPF